MKTKTEIRYICAVCGGIEEDENGMCVYGHDDWMEIEGSGILPSQAEVFQKNLGLSVAVALKAFYGDQESIEKILEAHKQYGLKHQSRQPITIT